MEDMIIEIENIVRQRERFYNDSYIYKTVKRSLIYYFKIIIKKFLVNKRNMDILAALIGLIALSPVFLVVSLLIKITSKGPIMFKHKRVGQYGKEIYIYKFRTMVHNAESLLEKFTPEQKKEFEENYKLKDDPRIIGIGKYLRKLSLDEFPQLINILNGDMSIVGPRPVVTDELKKYGQYVNLFLQVKPGLTGNWQVNGRSDTSYGERVLLDVEYVNNMSVLFDIEIMLKTVVRVFKKQGAY